MTRYTTSSFLRLKLSEQLSHRGLAPHIYEAARKLEAMKWEKSGQGFYDYRTPVPPALPTDEALNLLEMGVTGNRVRQ